MHLAKGLIILVYIDNITIAAKDIKQISQFKDAFSQIFKIKDLGELSMILRVRVTRDRKRGTLRLDQTYYVKSTLAKLLIEKDTYRPTKLLIDSYDNL